jgi:hypothetical protein
MNKEQVTNNKLQRHLLWGLPSQEGNPLFDKINSKKNSPFTTSHLITT